MEIEYPQKTEKAKRLKSAVPIAIKVIIITFSVLINVLFYTLRMNKNVMIFATERISSPIRSVLVRINSIFPFSMMEILLTISGIWAIVYLTRSVVFSIRRRESKLLLKCIVTISCVCLYGWGAFCWLWNSYYYAPGYAEKYSFQSVNVNLENLYEVTKLFAHKSNELAALMERDSDGNIISNKDDIFEKSTGIYETLFDEFPGIKTQLYRPKPMIYSWLMSRTGYTGIYFALTGESNINTRAPLLLMPVTIAHELAHQCGIAAEDEANFIGILACITSDETKYEYAGYLLGLIHLRNAILSEDPEKWVEITGQMNAKVRADLQYNNEYWLSQKKVTTGVDFLDNLLTTVTETVSDTVNTAYDGYLKSQDQELGLRSYGACVDLLVDYFSKKAA